MTSLPVPPIMSNMARPSVMSLSLNRAGARHQTDAQAKVRYKAQSAMTKHLCGIYCMIACVFGTVFPISDALAQTDSSQHLYYTEVFHCVMYSLGVFVFVYFFVLIGLQRRRLKLSGKYSDIELDVIAGGVGSSRPVSRKTSNVDWEIGPNGQNVAVRLMNRERYSYPLLHDSQHMKEIEELEKDASVTYEAEGVNFYLRLGAIGFGVGGMVQCGFRISEPFEDANSLECRSFLFLLNAALYLIFVFMQTFFIFKYHKVVIHRHKAFVRVCLMHVLATNLSVWLSTTTHETAEDIGRVSAKSLSAAGSTGSAANISVALGAALYRFGKEVTENYMKNASGGHQVAGAESHKTEDAHIINCHHTHTLSDRSAPYLFPCLIEYSLIGAAVAYRTFLNVGKKLVQDEDGDADGCGGGEVQYVEPVECHKSNRGLFMGLLMILVTFVSVALFFVFDDDKDKKHISSGIFLCTEMFLFFIGVIACAIGLMYTRRLAYVGLVDEDFFDDKLLLIAQMGVYLLSTCVMISSATALVVRGGGTLPLMYLCMAFLNFAQSSIQTAFILDGLRRCAGSDDHMIKKPGRAVITFLLVCNLAMWTVNTFEIKKAEVVDIHVEFFQYMPWSIIMHLCVPLVIFYRFHSSVCLSDVWHNAYVKRSIVDFEESLRLLEQKKRKKKMKKKLQKLNKEEKNHQT